MNRVEISGGLTRDPSIEQVGGYDRVGFTIAVNGTRYDSQQGQQVVKTFYASCVAWGPTAVECMALKKGDEVYVVGELDQYRKPDKDQPSTRITVFMLTVMREGRGHQQQKPPEGDPWS